MEDHYREVLSDLKARRDHCDALVSILSASEVMTLTRIGRFTMDGQQGGLMAMLKRLRGAGKDRNASAGARQMKMLKRLPKILRFIPGTAQDVRAYFLTLQYWLAGSDDNVVNMIRMLIDRYAGGARQSLRGAVKVAAPIAYPDTGVYHPRMKGRISATAGNLPKSASPAGERGTVGVLGLRSYMLAGNAAHYDGVIEALEARGLRVVPAFAAGLDSRPAIEEFFLKDGRPVIDALVSLTGFSLVGGPAYNDAHAAEEVLAKLDVPYIAAHPAELQTLEQWGASERGLMPVEFDHHGRDPRTRRRHRTHRLRRTLRQLRTALHRLPQGLRLHVGQQRPRHARLRRARRHAGGAGGQAGDAAAYRTGEAQDRRRPVQLPAQCRQRRYRRLSRGLRLAAPDAGRDEGGRLRGGPASHRGRPARPHHRRQSRTLRRPRQCPCQGARRRDGPARSLAERDRGAVGTGPRQAPERRRVGLRPGRAVRQRLRRHPARLRLRRRPDAAAVREGLRPDPRVLRLLPLAAGRLPGAGRAAFRHPRRAGVHARQAGRHVGQGLAGPPDRRSAQPVSLRRQQPVGRRAGQAPRLRDPHQLPDAADRPCRPLSRAARPEGVDRPLAQPRSGCGPGAPRPYDADPGPGRPGRTGRSRAGLDRRRRTPHPAARRPGAGA